MVFYFAYGSNMNCKDLLSWCHKKNLEINLNNPRVAVLLGYKLGFTHYSNIRKCGVTDVINGKDNKDSKVYGVLFETDEKSMENLNEKEGVKCVNKGVYKRIKVNVVSENKNFNAYTYEVIKKGYFRPNKNYLDIIIKGAK
jgi:gamma-glutamylcyclotransferase (GGCT)/AIG2-like uncharacterized protein YtfP